MKHPIAPGFVRVSEAAAVLGISKKAAYRSVAEGRLPVVRLGKGKMLRVPRAWLEAISAGRPWGGLRLGAGVTGIGGDPGKVPTVTVAPRLRRGPPPSID